MTLPAERQKSIAATSRFLEKLAASREFLPGRVEYLSVFSAEARRLLRHFPTPAEVDGMFPNEPPVSHLFPPEEEPSDA